jgi:hypothetical protein
MATKITTGGIVERTGLLFSVDACSRYGLSSKGDIDNVRGKINWKGGGKKWLWLILRYCSTLNYVGGK